MVENNLGRQNGDFVSPVRSSHSKVFYKIGALK